MFTEIGKIVDAEFLAIEALPILWAFALGPLLNLPQFQAFISLIQTYQARIVSEQTRKLQDLSATQPPIASRNEFMSFARVSATNGNDSGPSISEGDFESLVLGRMEPKHLSDNVSDALDGWTTSNPPGMTSPGLSSASGVQATSQAVAFSWSTPAAQPQTRLSAAPALSSYRAITPDHTLNAYSTLQPASQNQVSSNSISPRSLQPSQVGLPTLTTQSLATGLNTQPISNSTPADWSSSANTNWSSSSTMSSSNIWSSGLQTLQPHRPASNPPFGQTTNMPIRPVQPSAFSIPPPSGSPYGGFSIAPPPAGGSRQNSYNAGGGQTMAQQQAQQGQVPQQQPPTQVSKGGLDKYESLL